MKSLEDLVEEEQKKLQEARKAERKERKSKVKAGRSIKRMGYRAEKEIEAELRGFGFYRVPLSGSLGGKLSGDLRRDLKGNPLQILEIKRRSGAQKQLRDFLAQGNADAVIIVPMGGEEALVFLSLSKLKEILHFYESRP